MKKMPFIYMFLVFCISLSAQEERIADDLAFTVTVKDLSISSADELNLLVESETLLLLDGSLSSLTLLSGKEEEYLLEALLVQGEWKNLDEVIKYECRLIFQGNSWKEIVPDRTPRKVSEGMILLNSHVLVLGRLVGFDIVDGKPISYLLVDNIREIP